MSLFVFYFFILEDLTRSALLEEYSVILKNEIIYELVTNQSSEVKMHYHCLSQLQFEKLWSNYNISTHKISDLDKFGLNEENINCLKKYSRSLGDISDIIQNDTFINKEKFLQICINNFNYRVLDSVGNIDKNKRNSKVVEIKIPLINFSIPKSVIPIALILILNAHLLTLLNLVKTLKKILLHKRKENVISKETFQFFEDSYSPPLSKIIKIYYVILAIILIIIWFIWIQNLFNHAQQYLEKYSLVIYYNFFGDMNVGLASIFCIWIFSTFYSVSKSINRLK